LWSGTEILSIVELFGSQTRLFRVSKQSVPQSMLIEAAQAAADFGAAAGAVDEAAAAVFGLNRTDLRIIGLLREAGPLSAGRLSAAAALSPAATSTAIQRLTAAGYVTRTVDGKDRRRAVVALTASAADLCGQIYDPIGQAGLAELARYSAAEIALVTDVLRRGERLQLAQAERIRNLPQPDWGRPASMTS
jgi:DNA-binding MarR family transcriptional regulator